MNVFILPLERKHAEISYKWRNNPDVWKLTGSKPDRYITFQMEDEWIQGAISNPTQKRYAIIVDEVYVGNVQLTDIKDNSAEFHIFIGDTQYWGRGVATIATKLMIELAFNTYLFSEIYLFVKKQNIAAIRVYEKCGFVYYTEVDENIKMVIKRQDYDSKC